MAKYVDGFVTRVPAGKLTSFPHSVKLKPGETVVFSWIVVRSRRHRDRLDAMVMKAPRLEACMGQVMPFDMKRMFFGGFNEIVAL